MTPVPRIPPNRFSEMRMFTQEEMWLFQKNVMPTLPVEQDPETFGLIYRTQEDGTITLRARFWYAVSMLTRLRRYETHVHIFGEDFPCLQMGQCDICKDGHLKPTLATESDDGQYGFGICLEHLRFALRGLEEYKNPADSCCSAGLETD